MVDIVGSVYKNVAKRIKRMPCNSNRASSIGYFIPQLGGCLRRGVYERLNWQEKELHTAETQLIFDEGNEQEQWILRALADAGIPVIEQQTYYEWKAYNITGHIDGKIIDNSIAYPLEIKSMHPQIFDTMKVYEDFRKKPWTRAYTAQMTIYQLCQPVDLGYFLLKNKSNGQLRQIEAKLDYDLGEWCISTAEQINEHVKIGTYPVRISDREICKKCPFKLICLPDIQFGPELKITEDPLFEKKLDSYIDLKSSYKEYNSLWNKITSQAEAQADENGELNLVVGKYKITRTKKNNRTYTEVSEI